MCDVPLNIIHIEFFRLMDYDISWREIVYKLLAKGNIKCALLIFQIP